MKRFWFPLPICFCLAMTCTCVLTRPKRKRRSGNTTMLTWGIQQARCQSPGRDVVARGVYVDPETGEEAVGREEIEKEFADTFEGLKDAKLEIDVEAIKFLSPNVAVESGTARIVRPNEEPDESTYSALFVKRDGKWLLDRVTRNSRRLHRLRRLQTTNT